MQHAKTFLVCGLLLTGMNLSATEIPVVPVSAISKTTVETAEKKPMEHDSSGTSIVWATPGVNQIMPLAINHLNRIITPFNDPEITTVSTVTTQIRQNVIYVGTADETPVSLYITEKGEEGAALSFTIMPQRILPREITLKLTRQARSHTPTTGEKAKQWEQSQPYVATIRNLMRQLAVGEVPQGYTFTEEDVGAAIATCKQPGLHFDFSKDQQLVGHHLTVRIGVAKNITQKPVEFNEYSCANWGVAAVSAWPKNVLLPGESTEIYVVQKQSKPQSHQTKRPTLLGNPQ